MNGLSNTLKKAFKDKEYRHAYVDEFLNVSIATQIKVLREQRGWTQTQLADHVSPAMKQTRISIMENVNYSSWSINTLRKLAEAFDLTLRVSFEGFGDRLRDIEKINRAALERPSFEDDPVFVEKEDVKEEVKVTAASKALPDTEQEVSLDVRKPFLSIVPSMSAGASQYGKSQFGEAIAKQRGSIAGAKENQWMEPLKRAMA